MLPAQKIKLKKFSDKKIVVCLLLCLGLGQCYSDLSGDDPVSLKVVDLYPPEGSIEVPLNTKIIIHFDQYLDPEPLRYWNMVRVRSNGVYAGGASYYDMVDKRIRFELYSQLKPDFRYSYELQVDSLSSITGALLEAEVPEPIIFQTGTGVVINEDKEPNPTYSEDIQIILSEYCSCHGSDQWKMEEFTRQTLTESFSEQIPELRLVQPFDAPKSYMMHKILWDYPVRGGQPMPPPWSGGELLPVETLRLIEYWIRSGAR